MSLGIEDGPGMYDGLFDFDHDGKLNIFEKSAEMDYFADQSEGVSPEVKSLTDAIWEYYGGSFDQDGNPIRIGPEQIEVAYEFVKSKNEVGDDSQDKDTSENSPLPISISPDVIEQIYEMFVRGELPDEN